MEESPCEEVTNMKSPVFKGESSQAMPPCRKKHFARGLKEEPSHRMVTGLILLIF